MNDFSAYSAISVVKHSVLSIASATLLEPFDCSSIESVDARRR